MSGKRHTPGPWGILKVGHSIGIAPVDARGKPRDGRLTEDVAVIDAMALGEAEANARLIAAAPDLLSACEAALDWVRPHAGDSDEQRETFEQIERAITKAEGQP